MGRLVDCVFTCIATISDKECIVCTDTGLVCILDDTGTQQKLLLVKSFDFGVSSVSMDSESGYVWFGGRDRTFRKYAVDELRGEISRETSPPRSPLRQAARSKAPAIVSMGIISAQMVTVDSTRAIRVCSLEKLEDGHIEDQADVCMPAHKDAVLGLGSLTTLNSFSADFFTWSCCGAVSFWDLQGKCKATKKIELEQPSRNDDDANELKILRAIEDMGVFVSGDRYGVLRFVYCPFPSPMLWLVSDSIFSGLSRERTGNAPTNSGRMARRLRISRHSQVRLFASLLAPAGIE